jgi:hypothetical protein
VNRLLKIGQEDSIYGLFHKFELMVKRISQCSRGYCQVRTIAKRSLEGLHWGSLTEESSKNYFCLQIHS